MPELPDVELLNRRLRHGLVGATITAARSADKRILRPQSPAAFTRALEGRTVRDVSRRGKWLRVALDDGERLFSHLGMTGWWVERAPEDPKEPSERARIDAAHRKGGTSSLRYVDSRRFGRLLVADEDLAEWTELGPDPLVDGIDVGQLAAAFARSRRAVKEVLMDQTVIAGIGNILATEAMWHARIDPRSQGDALSREEVAKVARGLRMAIRRQLDTRLRAKGDDWQDVFAVYGRAGEACTRDGGRIAKVTLGGRTTTYCPKCQVLRGAKRKGGKGS